MKNCLITAVEVSQLLGVDLAFVNKVINQKALCTVPIEGERFIELSDLKSWLLQE